MEIANKKICFDIFNRCNCNQSIEIINNKDEFGENHLIKFDQIHHFIKFDQIHQFSLRVIL